ncbi:AAA family ATPase [Erysipelotrichaceae bacterium OttesenSCG-928-M19]|nr:AAA family ATPase [Erysipelotrichaceae bacterium OttesenSCG-928-M19]
MKFDINLLGEVKVKRNDEEVKFPFKKTEILFAYLLINNEVQRKEVASLLWENVDETEVRKNLRNALYTLRKVLDKDIIITEGNNIIALNPNYIYNCDYLKLIKSNDPHEVIELYDKFLDNLKLIKMTNFQKWMNKIQEQLLNIYIDACDKLIFEYQESDDLDAALKMLVQKVKYYEYDEESYREIMKIYLKRNEYDKAIEAYSTISNILSNNLKIKCEQETVKLYEKIVNMKLSMIKNKRITNISTENEVILKKLIASYDRLIKYNNSASYIISGETGLGKSFLINQFLAYIKKDVHVFKIHCYQNDRDYVYRSIEPFISELATTFNTLSFNDILTLSLRDANAAMKVEKRYYYFDQYFIKMLEKLLANNKIVLIIEDINYLDISSQKLFAKICEASLDNLFIIFTTTQSKQNEVAMFEHTQLLTITPWLRSDVKDYLQRKKYQKIISDSYIDIIFKKSQGNPFFIKHYLKYDNVDSLSNELIFARIYENLSLNEKRVIDLLAIFVRSTSLKNLKTLVTFSDLELIEILRKLEEDEIVISYKSNQSIVYQISSDLFKDYVYNSLNKYIKRQLHNTIANNLEVNSLDVESPLYLYQSLLEHYQAANNKIKEIEYKIKYYSIKNYAPCELFSIMGVSLIDSLYLDQDENFNYILNDLEKELNNLTSNNVFTSYFKEMSILFYTMKARYYLQKVDNEQSYEAINILMSVTDNMEDTIKRHNTYYLMIYYSINANDYNMLDTILNKLLKSIQLLDTFSIDYTKSMITYSRFRGYYYMVKNNPEKAIYYLKKGLSITNNTNFDIDGTFQASIYHYLGQVYLADKKYHEAIESFNRCLRLLLKDNLLVDAILVTRGFLAISYYLNNDLKKAQENASMFEEYQSYKNFYLKERLFASCFKVIFENYVFAEKPLLDNEFDYQIYSLVNEKK